MANPGEKRPGGNQAKTPSRASTPKPATQAGDIEETLRKAIGSTVKIVTNQSPSQTYEGRLFTACPVTQLIAVNVSGSQNASNGPQTLSGNFVVIPGTSIEKISLVHQSSGAEAEHSALPAGSFVVSQERLQALKSREEAALRKQKNKDATRGKGVSKEGQDIFDAIHKTLPTRWHGSTIVVNDAVMIDEPYTLSSCQVEKGKEASLTQVKKIMDNFFARKRPVAPSPKPNSSNLNTAPSASPAPQRQPKPAVVVPVLPLKGG